MDLIAVTANNNQSHSFPEEALKTPGDTGEAQDRNFAKRAIEAILFAAGAAVPLEKLAEAVGIDIKTTSALCDELALECENRGIQLLSLGDRRQFCTKEEYEPYIKAALGVRPPGGLSQAALEVLAIIAYNQPTTRVFVEQVRGTDSSHAITTLLERGLIECVGKLDVPGKPNLYATTPEFLRLFGLSSLDELPAIDALRLSDEPEEEGGL
ncbi:MAG TPA: SMC-Scp complex subunit ScpB [Clostridiales bacterium]|nr:SMC-Scp complex subunit ScpB [Clostridiales bacterium]